MAIANFFVKIFIVVGSAVLFLYIVGKISYPGAIGLRPIDDGCFGVSLRNDEVYGKLPWGRIWLKSFNFEYYVPKKVEGVEKKSPNGFCLGKNFWDKEGDLQLQREREKTEDKK